MIALRVENLSKSYRLGRRANDGGAGYLTLREELVRFPKRLLGSLARAGSGNGTREEEFYALRDVNFEVQQGEVLGVIGRNGAGKSTLLKILSRITEPTAGRVEIHGRVASLLEVGTGFHPELTGRENIFLNGAILGMRRTEIKAKFDEIVAFAEVEKFLDTPVKRYSSGMYVRLAFAVAAHLEPEILIVDEVLAVGDAEFQKKCLGKMQDVASREGRTVLFVSHNLGAVRALCSTAILLKQGQLTLNGTAAKVIDEYLTSSENQGGSIIWDENRAPAANYIRFVGASVLNARGEPALNINCSETFTLAVEYCVLRPTPNLLIGFFMQTAEGIMMCGSNDEDTSQGKITEPGTYVTRCEFAGNVLNAGTFFVGFGSDVIGYDDPPVRTEASLYFQVVDHQGHGPRKVPLPGLIRPRLRWNDVPAHPSSPTDTVHRDGC
jgi:lipopolysaccharide transport system ATP-binding protein